MRDDSRRSHLIAAITARLNAYDDTGLKSLLAYMDSLDDQQSAKELVFDNWEPAERYATRTNAAEDIVGFIERLYGDKLDGSFTRGDLRKHDQGAYVALSNWLRSHPLPKHIKLPTVKERNARLIHEGRIEQLRNQDTLTNEEMKELRKLESIRSKMQRRDKSATI